MNEITGSMRSLDAKRGAVRVEDVYDTGIDDLWEAVTDPGRLARWIAQVSGDLHVGGTVQAVFTSTWSGSGRIDACDRPGHLMLTMQPGTDEETEIEAWLTAETAGTRLVVEERGLQRDVLHFHGAGWQAHLEDLERSLTGRAAGEWSSQAAEPGWRARWDELTPAYEQRAVD